MKKPSRKHVHIYINYFGIHKSHLILISNAQLWSLGKSRCLDTRFKVNPSSTWVYVDVPNEVSRGPPGHRKSQRRLLIRGVLGLCSPGDKSRQHPQVMAIRQCHCILYQRPSDAAILQGGCVKAANDFCHPRHGNFVHVQSINVQIMKYITCL